MRRSRQIDAKPSSAFVRPRDRRGAPDRQDVVAVGLCAGGNEQGPLHHTPWPLAIATKIAYWCRRCRHHCVLDWHLPSICFLCCCGWFSFCSMLGSHRFSFRSSPVIILPMGTSDSANKQKRYIVGVFSIMPICRRICRQYTSNSPKFIGLPLLTV